METKIIPAQDLAAFDELQRVLKGLPDLNLFKGPWIAGGAARRLLMSESVSGGDIDIFFKDRPQITAFRKNLEARAIRDIKTKYAETYFIEVDDKTYTIQLIVRRFYEDGLPGLFKDFDFTACQLAFDGSHVIAKLEAYEDIMAGKLKFAADGRTNAKNLVRRALKYIQYGFTPVKGIMNNIVSVGLANSHLLLEREAASDYDWDDDPAESIDLNDEEL